MADIFADLFEPIDAVVTADTTLYTADNAIWPTADGGLLEGARDVLDAEVIAIPIPVPVPVRRPWRPPAVVGHGFGYLPPLRGEAHGEVVIAGDAVGTLQLRGAGVGEHDDDDLLVTLMVLLAA
jgi:hypothetical protein